MRVKDILRTKGAFVVTVTPASTVGELVALLAEKRIGAMVVSVDGSDVAGIVSERDVVRALSADAGLLERPVSSIMTSNVITCELETDLIDMITIMTNQRFRHLPVIDGGRLAGIVSIGDIVKSRIDQLQAERDHLEAYIQS